jgi:hypothetical protein
MAKKLKPGDLVEWTTPQGRTVGKVKKRLAESTFIKGHKAAASPEQPEYLVHSIASGKQAAHKRGTLRKASKSRVGSLLKQRSGRK